MPYHGDLIAAGDPALTQIVKAFGILLGEMDDIDGQPVHVFVDRDDSEPIQPAERPAIVVRVVDVSLDERLDGGSSTVQVHAGTFDLDFYVDADMADNVSFQHNKMIADAMALIQADAHGSPPSWTLGGRLYELVPMSVTAASDVVPAAGVSILTFDGRWQTEFADWTKIVF